MTVATTPTGQTGRQVLDPIPDRRDPVRASACDHGLGPVADERGRELEQARKALRACDPVLLGLIDAKPDLDYDAWRKALPVEGLFEALLFQVVGQQISVSAATAIHARLRALFPGGRPDPTGLARTPVETLRRLGFSARKAEYVRDLARRAAAGELDGLADLSHEEARHRLISFRGIGPWTADGALLIAFGYPDVLVAGDLVLRKAVQRAYGLPGLPSAKEVEAIGERWRPHRSLAAGYLFESMMGVAAPTPARGPRKTTGGRRGGTFNQEGLPCGS